MRACDHCLESCRVLLVMGTFLNALLRVITPFHYSSFPWVRERGIFNAVTGLEFLLVVFNQERRMVDKDF